MMHVARCPYAGCETHVIVWDDQSEGRHYTVDMTNPTSPTCQCQGYQFGLDCKHVVAAMEMWTTRKEEPMDEPTKAVVAAEPQVQALEGISGAVAASADRVRRAMLPYVEGAATYKQVAEIFIGAGIVPWDTPEQGAIVLMKAAELGIPATEATTYIDVVENRPRLRGRMTSAVIDRYNASIGRAGVDGITIVEQTPTRCTGIAKRGSREIKLTLTIEQFQHRLRTRRGNVHQGWDKYPADMLVAKVQARLGAQLYADILGGLEAVSAGHGYVVANEVVDAATGEITTTDATVLEEEPVTVEGEIVRRCVACDEELASDEQDVCARCGAPPDTADESAAAVDDDDIPVGDDLPPGYDEGDPVDDEPAPEVDEPALRKRHKGEKHAALTAADFMAVSRVVQSFDFEEGMGAVRLIRGWPTTDDGRPKPINKDAVTEWCVTYAPPGQGLDMIAHELTILQANR